MGSCVKEVEEELVQVEGIASAKALGGRRQELQEAEVEGGGRMGGGEAVRFRGVPKVKVKRAAGMCG